MSFICQNLSEKGQKNQSQRASRRQRSVARTSDKREHTSCLASRCSSQDIGRYIARCASYGSHMFSLERCASQDFGWYVASSASQHLLVLVPLVANIVFPARKIHSSFILVLQAEEESKTHLIPSHFQYSTYTIQPLFYSNRIILGGPMA